MIVLDKVADHLDGERRADQVLLAIAAGHADPDRLLRAITNVLAADGWTVMPSARLRGFVRAIQKNLEASHA